MLANDEALEIIAVVNDNWSNNQVIDRAVPFWINGLTQVDLTFAQVIMGLSKLIATETFRPTVAQIITASTPASQQLAVDELTDEFPITEVRQGELVVCGYFNMKTREKRMLSVAERPKAVLSNTPLMISEY